MAVRAPGRDARVRVGIAIGLIAAALLPRDAQIPAHQQSLYALGAAFATYGVAVGCRPRATG